MGEIIRYLYNQPECPEEKRHCVRFFYGNGVNLEIWKKFVNRFKGIKIQEMYGSTEGNVTLSKDQNNILQKKDHCRVSPFVMLHDYNMTDLLFFLSLSLSSFQSILRESLEQLVVFPFGTGLSFRVEWLKSMKPMERF